MMSVTFLKKAFISILYFLTAIIACFFALLLVLNFINPALSQDSQTLQTNQKPGAKEILRDIVKNLKTILKESMGKDMGSNPDTDSEQTPSEPPKESAPPGDQAPQALPPGSIPPGDQAPQALPPGSIPPGDQAPQALPPGSIPPGDQAPQALPLDSIPPGDQAPQALPLDSIPPGDQAPQALPLDSIPPGDQAPQALPPQGISTEAQPVGVPQSFVEDLSELPSEWMVDIYAKIAPFIYEYGDRKDPFDDPTIQAPAEGGVVIIPKTPPEEYDLGEIKLRGIIWHTQTPKALFELPGQAGYYTLIKGDKIGKNGVIFEIREDEVVIVETSYIGRGEDKKEEIKVKLKQMDRLKIFGSSEK